MKNTNAESANSVKIEIDIKKELKKRTEFYPAILGYLRDNGRRTKREITRYLVESFGIRRELMDVPKKNGNSLYENRMAWAIFDLHKTGLIRISERAVYEITDRGVEVSRFEFKQLKREVGGCLADDRKRSNIISKTSK